MDIGETIIKLLYLTNIAIGGYFLLIITVMKNANSPVGVILSIVWSGGLCVWGVWGLMQE